MNLLNTCLLIFVTLVNLAILFFAYVFRRMIIAEHDPRPDADPAPPCSDSPKAATERFLRSTLGDDEVLAAMAQAGIVKWSDARVAWHKLTGQDMGDEPDWNAWRNDERKKADKASFNLDDIFKSPRAGTSPADPSHSDERQAR